MTKNNIICIVGNPNCGKTTLFNALTNSNQIVGNWPGVTVEKKSGEYNYRDRHITVVDLPGIYSLQPSSAASEDEKVARDYIMLNEAELVVNIIDASNLERNLYLTTQVIEMQVPMIVVVNMLDVAARHQIKIDLKALEDKLGIPVIGIVAAKESGLEELNRCIDYQLDHPKVPFDPIQFPKDIEEAIREIGVDLGAQGVDSPYWIAEQILEGDSAIVEHLPGINLEHSNAVVRRINDEYKGDLDIAMADVRYQFVSRVARASMERTGELRKTMTDRLDLIVLNRWLGIPIFLFVMYLMFIFSINIGSAFIDFFDILFGGIFVQGFGELLTYMGCPDWLKTILADGVGGGIQTVSTFIPVIACLFLSLSFLEDSGYMARAAFVMDRFMRALGLPGKSFVPLIVGFGCGVPAIMSARTMEKRIDRIATVMMVPFMSCGARLPVYVLFAISFWPLGGQNLVFALYFIGIVVAILTGFILKKTALSGQTSAFVMEIPPYHMPTLKNLGIRTWDRLKSFILKAGQLIVVIVAILAFLNSLGTDGTFGNENTEKSVLSGIGRTIVPIFEPMGIQKDNWPAAVGVFTGVLAKEAVVGTLDSLYSGIGSKVHEEEAGKTEDKSEEHFNLKDTFLEAVGSVKENFEGFADFFKDPLSVHVEDNLTDVDEQAAEHDVDVGTVKAMKMLFDGKLGAFSYLLMVLLYIPCCASIGAMWREVGAKWTVFAALWTIVIGYSAATITYQVGTFAMHPTYSAVSVGVCLLLFVLLIVWLLTVGREQNGINIPRKKL
jgi:ferrous iron transport protein B